MKKLCKNCGIKKPLKEMADNTGGGGDGKRNQCKFCVSIQQKEYRAKMKKFVAKRIDMESRRAAKILITHGFDIDTIAKIFKVHYNTAKNLIKK